MIEPKLRFKADDRSQFPDWEEKKLAEMFKKVIEKNRLDLPPLTIVQGYGTIRRDESERRIAYDEKGLKNYKAVQKDDFIVHLRSFEGGLEIANQDGIVNPAYHVYRGNDEVHPSFYYPYFRSSSFIKGKLAICVTGVRDGKNIEMGAFDELLIPHPCLPEQQKIAEFLSTIDTVIQKQKETVSAWEERKKGVMQKLFSQEVRFKADDGSEFPEWEEKKLSEIASFHSGLTYTPDDVVDSENGVLVFRSSNIQNGRICYDDNVYVDKELKERNYVRLHDIVVCVRNGSKALVGKNALVTESDLNATWGAFMTVIRAKQNYEFVHQYLNSAFFKKEMYKDSGTATINQITTAMLNGCKLLVPSLSEQQKIAACLSSLDEVIEKQKATLVAWEELKKGLLQQMFV